nr:hypothetical protein [uncultured Chryseobacterium sp.]
MFDPDGRVTMAAITEVMWNATPDNTRSYWLNSDFDGGGKAGGAEVKDTLFIQEELQVWQQDME